VAEPLLHLLKVPDSAFKWSADYLKIFFLGAAGFTFYNILAGILRGMGDSLSALLFLLLATVLNIGLDIWFVAGFGLEVAGVALATVIAQLISAACCFVKLLRMRDVFDLTPQMLRLRKDTAARIVKLGIPSGMTQGIMAVAMLVVQSLTNSMGEQVMACNVIIMRVDGFAMMPNMSFGQAMSVYTGQNVGAGRLDRVEKGMKQGTLMAVGFATFITVILLFCGRFLFGLFTDTVELMDLAVRMMRILAVGYICVAVSQSLGGIMRGSGDTVTPMWITLFNTIILRIPVAYGLAYLSRSDAYPNGHPAALFTSLLVSWSIGALLS
jgi:putative MATE family efflux protein